MMQDHDEAYSCGECKGTFPSASSLLKHFAKYASEKNCKKSLPNLFPINAFSEEAPNESDRGSDSGIEDVNVIRYCLVTMEESDAKLDKKKKECSDCERQFEKVFDLKTQSLIHTEEKPFKCKVCSMGFNRNFNKKEHEKQVHGKCDWPEDIPDLKPISELKKKR